MKTGDYFVEDDLLLADVLAVVAVGVAPGARETVLLVDHLPDSRAVIVSE